MVVAPVNYALYLDGPATSTVFIKNSISLYIFTSLRIFSRLDIFGGGPSQVWAAATGIATANNDYVTGKPSFDTSPATISANPQFVNPALAMQYNGNGILLKRNEN